MPNGNYQYQEISTELLRALPAQDWLLKRRALIKIITIKINGSSPN